MKALGRQIVVEYYGCNPATLNDVALIKQVMRDAAEASGATIVQEAFHLFNPHGVSGVVVIAESHLTIHTWPEYSYAAVDLFTCGDDVNPDVAFDYLKALDEAGTPEEVANAKQNVIYLMGVMGHFAADAAQPLHTTVHHHGWVGANPQHYTTNTTIHRWIDGEFFLKTGGLDAKPLQARLRPARLLADSGKGEKIFAASVALIVAQCQQVEPLYRLEKEGKLSAEGAAGTAGRAFLESQLMKGSQFLGDLWLSAWQQAPEDNFLKTQLAKRKAGNGAAPAKP